MSEHTKAAHVSISRKSCGRFGSPPAREAVMFPLTLSLSMNHTLVGTSRCDVPAREGAGGIVAPLNAARTAQRAVPTRFRGSMREIFRGNLSLNRLSPDPATAGPPSPRKAEEGQREGRPGTGSGLAFAFTVYFP